MTSLLDLSPRPIHPPSIPPSGKAVPCPGLPPSPSQADADRWRAVDGGAKPKRDIGITTLLVGTLIGQHELSEAHRHGVGERMIHHADDSELRDLMTTAVRTQIVDTSQTRVNVPEAIRDKFRSGEGSPRANYEARPCS